MWYSGLFWSAEVCVYCADRQLCMFCYLENSLSKSIDRLGGLVDYPWHIMPRLKLSKINLKDVTVIAFQEHNTQTNNFEVVRHSKFCSLNYLGVCDNSDSQVVTIGHQCCFLSQYLNVFLILWLIINKGNNSGIESKLFQIDIHLSRFVKSFAFLK